MTEQTGRTNLLQRKVNVQKLREEIRKQFQERLKISRYNKQSERRDFLNNVLTNVTDNYKTIQQRLLLNVQDVLPEEMLHIMLDIETELLNDDLETALNENLGICSICNNIIEVTNKLPCIICNDCIALHFSSNF